MRYQKMKNTPPQFDRSILVLLLLLLNRPSLWRIYYALGN